MDNGSSSGNSKNNKERELQSLYYISPISLLRSAMINCSSLLRLCLQEMERKIPLSAVLMPGSQLHVGYLMGPFANLIKVCTFSTVVYVIPGMQWFCPLLILAKVMSPIYWLLRFDPETADETSDSGFCCGNRRKRPQLVDKQVQTENIDGLGQTENMCLLTHSAVQTTCDGLVQADKCRHNESQQMNKGGILAETERQNDGKGAKESSIIVTNSSEVRPVQQPDDRISCTEAQEIPSLTGTTLGLGDKVCNTKREPSANDDTEISFSRQNCLESENQKKSASEKSLVTVHVNKTKQHEKISRSFLEKSLQMVRHDHNHTGDLSELEQKVAALEESEKKAAVKRSLVKGLPSMRFTPNVQEQVYTCNRHQCDPCDAMWSERGRYASFDQYPLMPCSGVWVTKLAEAGFYCADTNSSILRCAFCQVDVDISSFINRAPVEVHRDMSPNCPLLKGEAPNRSMEEQRQKEGKTYIPAFFSNRASSLPVAADQNQQQNSQVPDKERQNGLGGVAVQTEHGRSSQLVPSGQSSESSSQPQTQLQRVAAATVSVPHPPQAEGERQGSGFPSAAVPFTHPPERRDRANEPVPPPQPTQQLSSQTPDMAQRTEQPPGVEPQTSAQAFAQPAPSLYTSQVTENPPSTFQTARPVERNDENTSEPSPGSNPSSAAVSAAAGSHDPSAPSVPGENESGRQLVTYAQLGIYTQEPKRPDFAIASTRLGTFTNWPHSASHPPEDMAEAGFYFTDVGDLVRCFYCKGGLKSWSRSLQPWEEHARFYPQCPFVGQVKGQEFIDVVQYLKDRQVQISEANINAELKKRGFCEPEQGMATVGGPSEAEEVVQKSLSGERTDDGASACAGKDDGAEQTHLEKAADDLENQNQEIKNERVCKICQVEEVSILFLPCGHLVSCSQCAPALRTCAVCRQRVKGRVRVRDDNSFQQSDRPTTASDTDQGELATI